MIPPAHRNLCLPNIFNCIGAIPDIAGCDNVVIKFLAGIEVVIVCIQSGNLKFSACSVLASRAQQTFHIQGSFTPSPSQLLYRSRDCRALLPCDAHTETCTPQFFRFMRLSEHFVNLHQLVDFHVRYDGNCLWTIRAVFRATLLF